MESFEVMRACDACWKCFHIGLDIHSDDLQMLMWDYATTLVIWTLYDFYMVYDATTSKFMLIIVLSWDPSNLVNVWWTTWPTTFSTTAWNVWDSAFECEAVHHVISKYITLGNNEIKH